jgi:hypothetical protein
LIFFGQVPFGVGGGTFYNNLLQLYSIGVLGMVLGGLIGSRIKKKVDLNNLNED